MRAANCGLVAALLLSLPAHAAPLQAYIGTYTSDHAARSENHGDGIYLVTVDPTTGIPGHPKLVAKSISPSWIALSADHKFLYAVNEYAGFGPQKSGAVSAYAIAAATGALTLLGTVSSEGAGPAYVSVHASGKFVMLANYGGGTFAIIRIRPDGSLGEPTDVIGPFPANHPAIAADNPPGQFAVSDHGGSHAHMIGNDPTGQFVIGDDAGRDEIHVWKLDVTGKLAEVSKTSALPGSAPRHFVFSADGKLLYQLFEQDSRLGVYNFNNGRPELRGKTVSLLPDGYGGSATGSELLITKDGKHIYAANRTQDSIAAFAVAAAGSVKRIANAATEADQPRSLTIDPSGQFLYSLNQRGDNITIFRIDPATGVPHFTGHYLPVPSPATMVFR
jgi:6-phosphogluconolactonase (cycloisomerase 2 family)